MKKKTRKAAIAAMILASSMLLSACRNNAIKKPVMYFYPEEDGTNITASIDFDGTFTTVYPYFTDEKEHSWDFTADKDGTITIDDTRYGYLFWEGIGNNPYTIKSGYCVEKKTMYHSLKK